MRTQFQRAGKKGVNIPHRLISSVNWEELGHSTNNKKYVPSETKPQIEPSAELQRSGIIFDLKVLILCLKLDLERDFF